MGGTFHSWKSAFTTEAKGLTALRGTSYSTGTIRADRGQKSFRLSLDAFMKKRGAAGIIARGRKLKATNAALFADLERRSGVPV